MKRLCDIASNMRNIVASEKVIHLGINSFNAGMFNPKNKVAKNINRCPKSIFLPE